MARYLKIESVFALPDDATDDHAKELVDRIEAFCDAIKHVNIGDWCWLAEDIEDLAE